jgi:DNA-binding MarR family transcriptional regulator
VAAAIPADQLLGFWVYRYQMQGSSLLWRKFRAAGHDVTPEQFWLLTRLLELEGLNQRELGERMLKDRHNMTRILDLLGRRGYIERRPDSGDKRMYRIFLTQNGRELQTKLTPIVIDHNEAIFEAVSEPDMETTRQTLRKIVKNIEKGLASK